MSAPPPVDLNALGRHTFPLAGVAPDAQRAFDRGLTLAYAFHHSRAEREFRRAARLAPDHPLPWWGVALVNGPHINFPMVPPDKAAVAWAALAKARERAGNVAGLERALVDALGARYAHPQPADRTRLDRAYADAMRQVWKDHPTSADAATLFAEAMMDLRPWDLWTAAGKPQPGTAEIVATLERALALQPDHPGALHLIIHAMEASPTPARALPAANRLLRLAPAASHLVHMPAHIYARVGRWQDARLSNALARDADAAWRRAEPHPGFYAMYMAHNDHFYAFAAMMQGRRADALRTAREMVGRIPDAFLDDYGPIADGFLVFVHEVQMRFGLWNELLDEPAPRRGLPLSTALWRFTRAVALTALDRRDDAQKERARFLAAARKVPRDAFFGNNPAADILTIARHMLDGEMAARQGRTDDAIRHLRTAVATEDRLRYDEPPDWIQPVRHTLGIVQLRAGRYDDAQHTYRTDLSVYPENGWSLHGLSRALRLGNRVKEARTVEARFATAWKYADIRLESSCFCQPGV